MNPIALGIISIGIIMLTSAWVLLVRKSIKQKKEIKRVQEEIQDFLIGEKLNANKD